mgnify:CR=1 FL=1|jgi:hypothetical protein
MNPEVAAALEAAQATMVVGGESGYSAMKRPRMNHGVPGMHHPAMQHTMQHGMPHMHHHPMHGHGVPHPMRMHAPPVLPALKLRGLPFTATEADVRHFFEQFDLIDILFVLREGRPSGIVFVLLGSGELAEIAMAQHNKGIMGRRYIDIFPASRDEYYQAVASHVAAHGTSATQDGPVPMAAAPTPAGMIGPSGPTGMAPKSMTELTSTEVGSPGPACSGGHASPRKQPDPTA